MSATKKQSDFIKDLILKKLRNFSEFKKWLATTGIVRTNGQIFNKSVTLTEMLNRITEKQASDIITEVQKIEDIVFDEKYSDEKIAKASKLIDSIKKEVDSWTFAS